MKEIIIKGKEIEVGLENGLTARGEYYFKNKEMYLKAKSSWDLAELMKYKEEIKKEVR